MSDFGDMAKVRHVLVGAFAAVAVIATGAGLYRVHERNAERQLENNLTTRVFDELSEYVDHNGAQMDVPAKTHLCGEYRPYGGRFTASKNNEQVASGTFCTGPGHSTKFKFDN